MLTPPERLGPLKKMRWLGEWLNQLRDYAAGLNPMPSLNIQVKHTAAGTSYIATQQTATAVSSGMVFRGEWDATLTYQPQDVVVVRNGASSGSYVCVRATVAGEAPQYPLTGEAWINLSPGNILGVYL